MRYWINVGGTPDYPVNWEGLNKLLEDVRCGKAAKDLKRHWLQQCIILLDDMLLKLPATSYLSHTAVCLCPSLPTSFCLPCILAQYRLHSPSRLHLSPPASPLPLPSLNLTSASCLPQPHLCLLPASVTPLPPPCLSHTSPPACLSLTSPSSPSTTPLPPACLSRTSPSCLPQPHLSLLPASATPLPPACLSHTFPSCLPQPHLSLLPASAAPLPPACLSRTCLPLPPACLSRTCLPLPPACLSCTPPACLSRTPPACLSRTSPSCLPQPHLSLLSASATALPPACFNWASSCSPHSQALVQVRYALLG